MRFIIQMVLFVSIGATVIPGLFANPVENEEQGVSYRWGTWCVNVWVGSWCSKSQLSPECELCVADCKNTVCLKKPEDNQPETPSECHKCASNCFEGVCKK